MSFGCRLSPVARLALSYLSPLARLISASSAISPNQNSLESVVLKIPDMNCTNCSMGLRLTPSSIGMGHGPMIQSAWHPPRFRFPLQKQFPRQIPALSLGFFSAWSPLSFYYFLYFIFCSLFGGRFAVIGQELAQTLRFCQEEDSVAERPRQIGRRAFLGCSTGCTSSRYQDQSHIAKA